MGGRKIVTPSLKKGINAEKRFDRVAKRVPSVLGVTQASWKMDRKGIDKILKVATPCGRVQKVPVQIKSSARVAKAYRQKYPTYVHVYKILIFIVNDDKSDEELCVEIESALVDIFETKRCYKAFFEMVRKKSLRKVQPKMPGVHLREANQIDVFLKEEEGMGVAEAHTDSDA